MAKTEAVATPLLSDEQTRTTRFDFAPGAETGWHVHDHDYVIVAVTDLTMRLELPGGETREVFTPAGQAYRRDKGTEHNVINAGDAPMSFVEVEIL
ncbi:cupin domain-containing protein [Salipiger sp. P9]|uniref:cupin domain-containing protein n=1 Tax=Salipiger pentaromativorans TaxID=2943193 RepID=UPI0021572C23|nr:cupin domain-containing protein [Salipiger pentaromativorans]MCR8547991.1 cupin domain-containing protein [Salipiger pentaromativorans]